MEGKKGFSLVELLIVLAVMAALISTITPVALNAVRKAKASQVAQNLKTIATGIENKAYIDGNFELTGGLSSIGRDVQDDYTAYIINDGNGEYDTWVVYENTEVNFSTVEEMLPGVAQVGAGPLTAVTALQATGSYRLERDHRELLAAGDLTATAGSIYYHYSLSIY